MANFLDLDGLDQEVVLEIPVLCVVLLGHGAAARTRHSCRTGLSDLWLFLTLCGRLPPPASKCSVMRRPFNGRTMRRKFDAPLKLIPVTSKT